MFNPFGAFSAIVGNIPKGISDQQDSEVKKYDLMGMQALGRAFQQMQGPIDQMNAQRGMPQPPMPGQPSSPGQPAGGPPMPPGPMQAPGGPPPVAAGPSPGPPMGPGGGGMPGGAPQGGMMPGGGQMIGGGAGGPGGPPMGGGGPQGGGMPQLDLQSLISRLNATNPGLPPQAMVAALTRAAPLLNIQGKQELALMRQQFQQQTLDLRRDALDVRAGQGDRRLDQGDRRLDQGDTREGRLTEQGDRRLGQGDRRLDMVQAGLDEKRREFDAREQRIALRAEEQSASGMSPDAKADAAKRYNSTGQLPSLGWGSQARKDKADILNIATEQRQAAGLSVDKVIKDQQKLKAEQVGIQRFMSGPQGNVTRSLGVVVDHLSVMRDLTAALENGDTKLFNRARQNWLEQTGSELPTNVQAAAQIVGAEIIKALGVAGAGTEKERSEAAGMFSTAKSPEQLRGAIGTVQPLLGGQLKGMRRQFISATGLSGEEFDAMVGSEAKKFLEGGGAGGGGAQSTEDSFSDRFKGGSAPKVDLGGGWSAQRVR